MEIKSINKYKTHLPDKSAFQIETDPDFIKMPTLSVFSGRRGGGKSVAVANLLRTAKQKHYCDLVLLITPTYNSNKPIWDICGIDESDVFEPTKNVLKDIVKRVEAEKQEFETFLARQKQFAKYKKDIQHKPIHMIPPNQLMEYLDYGFLDNTFDEKWKYPVLQPPRISVVIDDAMGTDLMACRTAGLTNLAIRHRHIADGLGISLFMLVQSYCAQGGVARPIRENTTHLFLFKINDEKQIAKVREESDLPVTEEEWRDMCGKAHSIPYNFLLCDFSAKCPQKRFRSGMNDYLIPTSIKQKEKCMCKGK